MIYRASFLFLLCANVLLATACGTNTEQSAKTITVSAAADLTPAFQEIGALYKEQTGTTVNFNFGSTGQLTQQIEAGAPVDVFAAANVCYIEELEKKNLILPDTKQIYANGRICIWTRQNSNMKLERVEDLAGEAVKRIAIANPEHAPYGVAAREALQTAGIWERVQPKLVFGENINQTLQYAEIGNVTVAIVALSLSVNSNGQWTLIPAEQHQPLRQALAVIKSTVNEAHARRFAAFINGSAGRPIMQKYGFVPPDQEAGQ